MIKNIVKICIIIIIAILQVTLMPQLAVGGVWPNLVLISCIMLLLFNFTGDAFLTAAIGGIVLDLTGILAFGSITLFLIGYIYALNIIAKKFFPEVNAFVVFISVFASSIMYTVFNYLLLGKWPQPTLFLEAIYAVVISEIIFYFYSSKVSKQTIFKVRDK